MIGGSAYYDLVTPGKAGQVAFSEKEIRWIGEGLGRLGSAVSCLTTLATGTFLSDQPDLWQSIINDHKDDDATDHNSLQGQIYTAQSNLSYLINLGERNTIICQRLYHGPLAFPPTLSPEMFSDLSTAWTLTNPLKHRTHIDHSVNASRLAPIVMGGESVWYFTTFRSSDDPNDPRRPNEPMPLFLAVGRAIQTRTRLSLQYTSDDEPFGNNARFGPVSLDIYLPLDLPLVKRRDIEYYAPRLIEQVYLELGVQKTLVSKDSVRIRKIGEFSTCEGCGWRTQDHKNQMVSIFEVRIFVYFMMLICSLDFNS